MVWKNTEKTIRKRFDTQILKWHEHNAERIYADIDSIHLVECIRFLFEELQARFIIASAVDTPRHGVEILYHFDFYQLPQVFTVRVFIRKPNLEVESVSRIIKGAEWIEREIAELFGIRFKDHPNPVHLILPLDWPEGNYPLRRDS